MLSVGIVGLPNVGNQFLGEIRAVDAIAHVLRCFADPDVAHVFAEPDPIRDAGVVETELVLADLELVERLVERRDREWRTRPQEHAAERERLQRWRSAFEQGRSLRSLGMADPSAPKGLGLTVTVRDPHPRSRPRRSIRARARHRDGTKAQRRTKGRAAPIEDDSSQRAQRPRRRRSWEWLEERLFEHLAQVDHSGDDALLEMVAFDGSGHFAQIEEPERFVEVLTGFLGTSG